MRLFDWFRRPERELRVERKFLAFGVGAPVWPCRDPTAFAREGYARNAVAYRCVRLIAEAAASAPLKVTPEEHPLAALLKRPNPEQTGVEMFEAFFGHLQVSGNAFLEASAFDDEPPREVFVLRPDRMRVIAGPNGWPIAASCACGSRRPNRD